MDAGLLTRLIEAGTPADLVAEVALQMARADADREVLERRRAVGAERVRRHRAAKANDADVTPCNVTSVTVTADPSPLVPPLSPAPLSPPIIPPSLSKTERKRALRCPDDWQPKPLPSEIAAEVMRRPSGWLERQLAGMRDWSRSSPNGAKLDWDAAWRNWIKRELEKPHGNNGNNRNGCAPSATDIAMARLAQLTAEEQGGMGDSGAQGLRLLAQHAG